MKGASRKKHQHIRFFSLLRAKEHFFSPYGFFGFGLSEYGYSFYRVASPVFTSRWRFIICGLCARPWDSEKRQTWINSRVTRGRKEPVCLRTNRLFRLWGEQLANCRPLCSRLSISSTRISLSLRKFIARRFHSTSNCDGIVSVPFSCERFSMAPFSTAARWTIGFFFLAPLFHRKNRTPP